MIKRHPLLNIYLLSIYKSKEEINCLRIFIDSLLYRLICIYGKKPVIKVLNIRIFLLKSKPRIILIKTDIFWMSILDKNNKFTYELCDMQLFFDLRKRRLNFTILLFCYLIC